MCSFKARNTNIPKKKYTLIIPSTHISVSNGINSFFDDDICGGGRSGYIGGSEHSRSPTLLFLQQPDEEGLCERVIPDFFLFSIV